MAGIDSFTVLMLHMNGTNGSTTFTDSAFAGSAPHTVTPSGNAQISTAQSVFGGASGLFDGSGDFLTTASSTDWNFGIGDFTIDFRARYLAGPGTNMDLLNRGDAGDPLDTAIKVNNSSNVLFYIMGNARVVTAWSFSQNTWYHVAAVRSGTNVYLFVDGTQLGSTGTDSANVTSSNSISIAQNPSGGNYLNGYLDELRISKGVARWTSNFTPPTSEYSVDATNTGNFFMLF